MITRLFLLPFGFFLGVAVAAGVGLMQPSRGKPACSCQAKACLCGPACQCGCASGLPCGCAKPVEPEVVHIFVPQLYRRFPSEPTCAKTCRDVNDWYLSLEAYLFELDAKVLRVPKDEPRPTKAPRRIGPPSCAD